MMPKNYLTAKELGFFLLPLIVVLYIFMYPNDFKNINNQISDLISTEHILDKDILSAKKMLISY